MKEPFISDERINERGWSHHGVDISPFRSAFEYAAIGMVLVDTEGRCLAANRAFCEMVGYAEDELMQLEFARITHPDDIDENLRRGLQLVHGKIDSFIYEKRYFHKQGHIIWCLLSASIVRDEYGHPLYVISQIQDITEQKRAAAAEREQRELAEALRDTAETLGSTRNLDEILDRILLNARRIVPYDFGTIMLVDEHGAAYVTRSRDYAANDVTQIARSARFPVTATATMRTMSETGQPLIVPDVHLFPGWVMVPGQEWVHSHLGVPIRVGGQVVGFINLDNALPGFFTPQHAERLQALAHQAAIAIENVQMLQAEREKSDLAEALREAAEVLNSTLDLNQVLDRILHNAGRVVPYDAINIMLVDGLGMASVVRSHGYRELGIEDWVRALRLRVDSTHGLQFMLETHLPHVVADTRADPDWVGFPETHWLRSYVGVPIRIGGQIVGFLDFDSATPNFFTPEHGRRAQAFADQVAVAMQNARSFEAIQHSVRRFTLLHQAAIDLAQAQSAAQLHKVILRAALNLVGARASSLTQYDGQEHLITVAAENMPAHVLGQSIPLGHGLSGRAAQLREILCVANYAEYDDPIELARDLPLASAVAVPLIWQDQLVGTLSINDDQIRHFSREDLDGLNLLATLVAAALEQHRAMANAHARETEARTLSNRLANAQEEERSRVASLLHDSIGNQLVTIQKNTEVLQTMLPNDDPAAPYLDTNLELLLQTHQLVRHLAMDLNSKVLSDLGLVPAARQYVDGLRANTSLPIKLHITGQVRRLPAEIERTAFRGLQETMTNALRHAQATEITAQLHIGSKSLRLTVQDNGRGFDQSEFHQGTALGLPLLRRQAEGVHGDLFIESTPSSGTMVALRLPIRSAPADGLHRARVLVVDDHEMMRQGLRQILSNTDDFVCIGEAVDGHEAVRQAELFLPDLIVMDVKLPGGSGIETTRQIAKRFSHARVVIYTYHDDETYLEQALQAGAKGYVLKSDPNQSILAALRAVLSGETFISPALTNAWEKLQTHASVTEPLDSLSSRERQVLQLVASGEPNQVIAERLNISIRTVEVHRRNIMDKLGVKNSAQMIKFAVDHGLI